MWALQGNPLENARKLAASVGCITNYSSTEFFITCMQERPAQQIVRNHNIFTVVKRFPFAPFGPVVEKQVFNAFLPYKPQELLLTGQINDVPWINSVTAQEGALSGAGRFILNS